MILALPLFLLYAVYGMVNACLPLLLRSLGFTPASIGLLQGIFDAAGLAFPLFLSARVDRSGRYGRSLALCGLVMVISLPLLLRFPHFVIAAIVLSVFALGYKGAPPVADALLSRILGDRTDRYGSIRVIGTLGFVCMTLVLQFTSIVNTASNSSIVLWTIIPASAMALSVLLLPGLIKTRSSAGGSDQNSGENRTIENTSTMPRTGGALRLSAGTLALLKSFPVVFWGGIALVFLGFLGMTPSQRFFSLYVREFLGLESWAGLWALAAGAEMPLMLVSGLLIRRFGIKPLLAVSLAAVTLRNLVYAFIPTFGGAVLGQLLHSLCFGLFHPVAIALVIRHAPRHRLALGLTIYTAAAVGLASILGNVAGGFLIEFAGWKALFVLFSIPSTAALVLWAVFFRKRRD